MQFFGMTEEENNNREKREEGDGWIIPLQQESTPLLDIFK